MDAASLSPLSLVTGLLVTGILGAQADWYTDLAVPKARAVHTAVFDVVNNQIVLFGGNANAGVQGDTWLWSASAGWTNARPAVSPSARREHAMAYDLARGETVLYGGWDGSHVGDTWIWNGTAWRLAMPANSPSARMAEMAFDPVSGNVLLFGGQDPNGVRLNETWSWDGVTWTRLNPTRIPPARFDHSMATDWSRNEIVMFGGWDNGFLGDTWVWNGADWVPGPPTGPAPRSEHKMAFVGGTVILFAGQSNLGRDNQTWQWNGTGWTLLSPAVSPAVREEHVLVDGLATGNATLFGGWDSSTGHVADLWTFAAGQWTEVTSRQPTGTGTAAMAHDPVAGRSLMFGGYQDQQISDQTWSYANGVWTRLSPSTVPPARAEPAMVFDRARNELVMFGGLDGSIYYNDTWVFSGNNWQMRSPATTPPARWGHAMVYDESRGTVLMHSGRGLSGTLVDTWEWNGSDWVLVPTATIPSGREDHGMAYSVDLCEPVMFGGWIGGSGFTDETWAFRAGNWVLLSPTQRPAPRSEHAMAYDRARDCIVVFAGQTSAGRVADTWEFTGDWRQRQPNRAPEPREEAVMVFDELVDEIVMAVGWNLGHYTDTWHFASRPSATSVAYGTGCQGSAAALPVLSATRPWLGTSLTARATSLPAGAFAMMAYGVGRITLPLNQYGMPGCTGYTQPIVSAVIPTSGTAANVLIALPPVMAFVGAQMHMQTYVFAPGTNPLGVINTNGIELNLALK